MTNKGLFLMPEVLAESWCSMLMFPFSQPLFTDFAPGKQVPNVNCCYLLGNMEPWVVVGEINWLWQIRIHGKAVVRSHFRWKQTATWLVRCVIASSTAIIWYLDIFTPWPPVLSYWHHHYSFKEKRYNKRQLIFAIQKSIFLELKCNSNSTWPHFLMTWFSLSFSRHPTTMMLKEWKPVLKKELTHLILRTLSLPLSWAVGRAGMSQGLVYEWWVTA